MLDIGVEIECLKRAKVETIHFDVMDGVFVPRLGLHPEMLQAIRSRTDIPIDVHLMVEDPEPYLEAFVEAGATYVTVNGPLETTREMEPEPNQDVVNMIAASARSEVGAR